jgi:hypothetical protein
MRIIRLCGIVLFAATVSTSAMWAEDKPAPKPVEKAAEKKSPAETAFDRIKALAGEWTVAGAPEGHDEHGGSVTYKVTAGGNAVMEMVFGGSSHEMVTLYYVDGEDLMLTHYCVLHNRPTMRAEKSEKLDKIAFSCSKGDKIEAEDHMHAVTYTFPDADHLKADWVLYKGGKADSTHSFELVRKKATAAPSKKDSRP